MALAGFALAVLYFYLPLNTLCSLAQRDNDYHVQNADNSPGLEAQEGVAGNGSSHVGQLRITDYREY